MIRRRTFVAGLSALAVPVLAQPRMDLPRVGVLFVAAPPAVAARLASLRDGLAALGYAEGRQYTLEIAYGHGDFSRMPALAAELVRKPVALIVTGGSSATRPAVAATATIPIVMAQDNDPVGSRIVASLARPGGNVTGLTTLVPELAGKQLALLAEMIPGLSRVAVFGDAGESGNAQSQRAALQAAARLGVAVTSYDMRGAGDPKQLFDAAVKWRAGAVLMLASAYLFSRQSEIVALALTTRLPALYPYPDLIRFGALATYGVNVVDLFRQAAGYVVKILNGAAPGELPIAQPTRFEFLVNLTTAKALGIAIPQSVLVRADEVIR